MFRSLPAENPAGPPCRRTGPSFTLPSGVDAAKVDASFENGVLTLTLPKSELAKSRKISVG